MSNDNFRLLVFELNTRAIISELDPNRTKMLNIFGDQRLTRIPYICCDNEL